MEMSKLNLVRKGKSLREAAPTPTSSVAAPVLVVPEPSNDEQKDHFKTHDGKKYAGDHLIIDLWEATNLDKREVIEQAMIEAIEAAGATLLHIYLHTFGDGGGISGVAVLAESHISVHTWPETGYAAFDVFMCGDANPRATLPIFKAAFKPGRIVIGGHKRGVME